MSRAITGRSAIQARLADLSASIDPFLRSRARPLERLVPRHLAPDPTTGRIEWRHDAGGSACTVTLAPREDRLVAGCTCGQFGAHGQCKHVAALVAALLDRLRLDARAPTAPPAASPAGAAIGVQQEEAPSPGGGRRRGAGPLALGWRLRLLRDRVDVEPLVRLAPGRPPEALDLGGLWRLRAMAAEDAALRRLLLARRDAGAPRPAEADQALLEALLGHPRLEVEGRGPVELRRGRAGVLAAPVGERHALRPALDGEPVALWPGQATLTTDALVGLPVGSRALRFAPLSPAGVALLAAAAAQAEPLGPEALLAVVDRIEQAGAGLEVELPAALRGREVAPAVTVVLQVAPRGAAEEGADLALRTRPLLGGPAFAPGEGEPRVSALVGGERLLTRRDLPTELRAARRVAAALGLPGAGADGAPGADRWEHAVADGQRLLDLLDAFQERYGDSPGEARLEWPADAPRRLPVRGELRLVAREGGGGLDLEGGLLVEGELVGLAVLLAAAREGRRWASIGGGRFVELRRLLAGRLDELALFAQEVEGAQGEGRVEDRVRLPSAALVAIAPALEAAPSTPGLLELLARARAALAAEPAPPAELAGVLRPYQVEGWRWMTRLGALGAGGCLADEVGLGKTVQAIALLLSRRDRGPALVLTPTSVVFNWERELRRFAPSLRVRIHRGAGRVEGLDALGAGDVLVAGWALLARDVEWLELPVWGTLVLDEAQAIKNQDSQTARAARRLRAEQAVGLSATPLENHLGELWSVLQAVAPGLLGGWARFQARFGARAEQAPALSRLLRPFLLRRTRAQVLPELPPRTETRLDVVLGAQERAVYERCRLDALEALRAAPPGGPVRLLAALTVLREAATHARLVDPHAPAVSSKLGLLLERLAAPLAEGRRVLIFSPFVRHLLLAREALAARGVGALLLRGSTPGGERAALVDAFQRGEAPVFLVSLKAGGTGLNLTAAELVVHLDPWWNPAAEEQATGRAHRLGQARPVTVWRLVASDTIEEQVLALQERKRGLAASLLEEADAAGRATADELVALLREAVAAERSPAEGP